MVDTDTFIYGVGATNTRTETLSTTQITDSQNFANGSSTSNFSSTAQASFSGSDMSFNQSGFLSSQQQRANFGIARHLMSATNGGTQTTTIDNQVDTSRAGLQVLLQDTSVSPNLLQRGRIRAEGLSSSYEQFSQNVLGANKTTTLTTNATSGGAILSTDGTLGLSSAGNTTITSSTGNLSITSATGNTLNAGASAGLANPNTFLSAGTGGQANPMVRMENTGASSGSVALEVYRNKGTAGTAGDVLYNMSVYGRDSIQNKQEFTRITHTIRDPTNTAEDGSIEFGCFVNGAFTTMLQLNGNDVPSGEVNVLKPLDLTGNALKTSTGSMSIDTSASSTAGATLTLATKDNVAGSGAGLVLTGNTLLNASAGGNSGQHLCLTIGGTVYKIALLNA
jgi:hypothetical protein